MYQGGSRYSEGEGGIGMPSRQGYCLVYYNSSPSTLHWEDHTIKSSEGVQQGDPLGPILFCHTLHCHCNAAMFPDDVTLHQSLKLCTAPLGSKDSMPQCLRAGGMTRCRIILRVGVLGNLRIFQ